MTRSKGRRARIGSLVTVVLGALAIFALPGLASARDGSDDGDSAATIQSFDQTTMTLVIALPDEQTVSGTVTRRTKIRCEDERGDRRGGHGVRSREAEPGDDRSGHGEEAGDDRGDLGEEAGDDHGQGVEPGDDHGHHGVEPGDDNGGGDSSGPGPSQSGPSGHDDNGSGANCTTADLVAGAAVDEVELDFEHGTVRFDEVELAHSS
jgi:hypothetical protein